jgi:hypothetical protein
MYLFIYEAIITLENLRSGIEDRLYSMKAPKHKARTVAKADASSKLRIRDFSTAGVLHPRSKSDILGGRRKE